MASFEQYTATGTTTRDFTIPSFTSDEIKVRVNGNLKTVTTHYTIENYTPNGGTLTWTTGNAPGSGTVRIYRETSVDSPRATYVAGASVKANDLNNNQEQILRALQEEDALIQTHEIEDGAITADELADNSVTNAKVSSTANISGSKLADNSTPSNKLSNTVLRDLGSNLTSTATELNQLDGKTISDTLSTNSTTIPTGTAVNAWVVNLLNTLGGFTAIANEVSFPNANPDINNDAGTVVSITDAGGVVVNSSGVSTTGRTLGGSIVTINGFPSALQSKTLSAGMGLLVQTTSTLNTYTYHKVVGSDQDIITISDTVNAFNNRYRISSNDPTTDNDEGDLAYNTTTNILKIYDTSLNSGSGGWKSVQPTEAQLTNIGIIAGELGWETDMGLITGSLETSPNGNINTVANAISSINRYAEEYKIAATAPGNPDSGDLWYDTSTDKLKFYNSSSWQTVGVVTGSNITVDQSAKTTGSLVYYDGTAFKADATTTTSSIVHGGSF